MQEISTQNDQKPKKLNFKKYVYIIIIVLILGFGGFSYYKYSQLVEYNDSAIEAIQENQELKTDSENYKNLKNRIEVETNMCKDLILKEEGNFGKFSYCQSFLEFSESL